MVETPWQMTFEQYEDYMLNDKKPMDDLFEQPRESASSSMQLRLRTKHTALDRAALLKAEPVPEKAVKEYPELWDTRIRGGDNLLL